MALNECLCADVPLRTYSLTQAQWPTVVWVFFIATLVARCCRWLNFQLFSLRNTAQTAIFVNSAEEVTHSLLSFVAFVRRQNCADSFRAIFVKTCRIMDYWYENNPLNFAFDPTQNGRHFVFLRHDGSAK